MPRLTQLREEWLDASPGEFGTRTSREIIEHERARVPEALTGPEHIIDCDCPLCQMQADMPGIGFWFLDGCNMDDDFAFSDYRTREEWDKEQRDREEFDRRYEAEQAECDRLGVKFPKDGWGNPDYVWEESFTTSGTTGDSPGMTILLRLFSIGSQLAELIVALKEPPEDRASIDRLNRDFGNLREIAQSDDYATVEALIEPVLERFRESLGEVAAARPALEERAVELQNRLRRFLEPPHEVENADDGSRFFDDDIPF